MRIKIRASKMSRREDTGLQVSLRRRVRNRGVGEQEDRKGLG